MDPKQLSQLFCLLATGGRHRHVDGLLSTRTLLWGVVCSYCGEWEKDPKQSCVVCSGPVPIRRKGYVYPSQRLCPECSDRVHRVMTWHDANGVRPTGESVWRRWLELNEPRTKVSNVA